MNSKIASMLLKTETTTEFHGATGPVTEVPTGHQLLHFTVATVVTDEEAAVFRQLGATERGLAALASLLVPDRLCVEPRYCYGLNDLEEIARSSSSPASTDSPSSGDVTVLGRMFPPVR